MFRAPCVPRNLSHGNNASIHAKLQFVRSRSRRKLKGFEDPVVECMTDALR